MWITDEYGLEGEPEYQESIKAELRSEYANMIK